MQFLLTFALTISLALAEEILTAAPIRARDDDNPYATYPSVPKTASINGFADRIYDLYPDCAKPCLFQNTGQTPCPYWDTGCLCIMPNFAGGIGNCIADNCRGEDVVVATSLASSICSSAGVWEPYWMPPASVTTRLNEAATAVATEEPEETSSEQPAEQTSSEEPVVEETSTEEPVTEETSSEAPAVEETSSEEPVVEETSTHDPVVEESSTEAPAVEESSTEAPVVEESSSEQPAEETSTEEPVVEESSTEVPVVENTSTAESSAQVTSTNGDDDNPYATYPSVPKTASINGFADPIYDLYPDCAKPCLFQNTGQTPCPYWDTGCLCIMPNFAGGIGNCIADNCRGEDVVVATSLASSICSSAGVWEPYWMPPASVTTRLNEAATAVATDEPNTSSSSSDQPTVETYSEDTVVETSSEQSADETSSGESVTASSTDAGSIDAESTAVEESSIGESGEAESTSANDSNSTSLSSSVEESSEAVSTTSDIPSGTPSLVTCYVNGDAVDEVDLETGVCEFEIPEYLETFFNFDSVNDYDIQYYYARVSGIQYTNDIRSAGRIVSIPARVLYNLYTQLHQVHLTNSGPEEQRRKRDEVDDFIDSISETDGTPVDVYLSVGTPYTPDISSSAEPETSTLPESSVEPESTALPQSSAEAESTSSESPSDETKSTELPDTLTVTETCTDDEGHVVTETVIITSHVTEYCEQTSASGVQSSACDEQSSAKSKQSSASKEQDKVVTTIYSCESAKSSLESIKSSAESAHKTEIIASCESELSSIKSVESVAYVTLTSLIEVQESCIDKQTSLVKVQSSAASVQLSAAEAQESSRAVEYAKSAVSEASKAADQVETVVEYITLTVSHGHTEETTVAGGAHSGASSLQIQTSTVGEQASSSSPAVEIANSGISRTANAAALFISTGVLIGFFI